jgi:hypothetical protein
METTQVRLAEMTWVRLMGMGLAVWATAVGEIRRLTRSPTLKTAVVEWAAETAVAGRAGAVAALVAAT